MGQHLLFSDSSDESSAFSYKPPVNEDRTFDQEQGMKDLIDLCGSSVSSDDFTAPPGGKGKRPRKLDFSNPGIIQKNQMNDGMRKYVKNRMNECGSKVEMLEYALLHDKVEMLEIAEVFERETLGMTLFEKNIETVTSEENDGADELGTFKFNTKNVYEVYPATVELSFMGLTKEHKMTKYTFLLDSGTTCHLTNSLEGMTNVRQLETAITVGNGDTMRGTLVGDKRVTMISESVYTEDLVLKECQYVPGIHVNLFSTGRALMSGYKISNTGTTMILNKGHCHIIFDKIIKTGRGYVAGVEMVPRSMDQVYAYTCINKKIPVENSRVHSMLGHSGKKCVIATAKFYGWKLKGDFKTCQDCAMAKARQKNIAKTTSTKSTVGGERLFFDIASINQSSFGGNQYWILVLDNFSGFCWTFFCKEKSDLPEIILKLLKDLAQSGKKVKFVRCDGAGENKSLKALCDSEERGITFEFTARNTPQHNGRVERKFQTIFARTRAMLNAANFTPAWRKGVWPEAASTATNIDNALVHKEGEAPPHVKLFGREPKFIEHLRTFGEVAIVLDPTKHKIRGKLDNRGEVVVFMGYPKDYAGDTYRMMNIATRQICHTRDLIWLNKSFGKYKQIVPNDEFDEETIEYENEDDALDNHDSDAKDLNSSDSDDEEPKDLGIL